MHPHGDVEIVPTGSTSFELRPRAGSFVDGIKVDIPQKGMDAHSDELGEEEASRRLKQFKKSHEWDPNMPSSEMDDIDEAIGHHDAKGENILVDELLENSPYPEVSCETLV